MGEVLQPRDRAYLDLLHHGLVLLRNFSHGGRVELCRVGGALILLVRFA
jgi:hypothetical protein